VEFRIGTAGWSIPRAVAASFPGEASHLSRYAAILAAAEINSSVHGPHAEAVSRKWAAATPEAFRFAVKVPRTITHEGKLRRVRQPLEQFLAQSAGLDGRRGPLLVQLPPSFAFARRVVARFFETLRAMWEGDVVCEPRHATWFDARPDALLASFRVARVAADPAPAPGADKPGGWPGLVYYRLHGSPRKYWSKYEDAFIERLHAELAAVSSEVPVWCIFDNTASGAALENAFDLWKRLGGER
jgi:uncharacterized protein YecE (DUF72 family)